MKYAYLVLAMFVSSSYAVTKITDKSQVSGPAVVKIYATWCGACKAVAPHYKKLSTDTPGVNFYEVDHDQAPNFSSGGIKYLPTFVFYDAQGKQVGTVVGAEIDQVKQKIKNLGSARVAELDAQSAQTQDEEIVLAGMDEETTKQEEPQEGFFGMVGSFFSSIANGLTKLLCGIVALVTGIFKK